MLQRCGPILPLEESAKEGSFRTMDTDLQASVARLLRALAQMSSARAVTLRSIAQAGSPMDLVAVSGVNTQACARIARAQPDCGVCASALRTGTMQSDDTACGCVRELDADSCATRQVVAVALKHKDRPCGVLSLFFEDADAAGQLPAGFLELLPPLAEMVGAAMENGVGAGSDLYTSVMRERNLLANEVHDSLAQHLTSIRMRTSLLRGAVAAQEQERAAQYLKEIDESLAVAQSRVRQIITDFRAPMDAPRLLPALQYAVEQLHGASGVPIELVCQVGEPRLSPYEEMQLFYIAREALTNALKHSQAGCVRLALDEQPGAYELLVEDDGVGFDDTRAAEHGHFGLHIMRERAERIGAIFEVQRREHGGTRVRLRLPAHTDSGEALQ